MYDPNDDTDVTSGTTDGAQMETTSAPDVRYGDHRFEDEASPTPTSRPPARLLVDPGVPGSTFHTVELAALLQARPLHTGQAAYFLT